MKPIALLTSTLAFVTFIAGCTADAPTGPDENVGSAGSPLIGTFAPGLSLFPVSGFGGTPLIVTTDEAMMQYDPTFSGAWDAYESGGPLMPLVFSVANNDSVPYSLFAKTNDQGRCQIVLPYSTLPTPTQLYIRNPASIGKSASCIPTTSHVSLVNNSGWVLRGRMVVKGIASDWQNLAYGEVGTLHFSADADEVTLDIQRHSGIGWEDACPPEDLVIGDDKTPSMSVSVTGSYFTGTWCRHL